MPRDPYRHNLSIHAEIYDKIKGKYDDSKSDKSFVGWVSDYLLMNLERDEFLKGYAPYLSKVGIEGNRLTIRDENTKSYHDVYLHENKLVCDTDNSDSCIHVRFALALPELGRLKSKEN